MSRSDSDLSASAPAPAPGVCSPRGVSEGRAGSLGAAAARGPTRRVSGDRLPGDEARPRHPGRRRFLTAAAAALGAVGLLLWRDLPAASLFLACLVAMLALLPMMARLARRCGAVALPGGRSVHERPTPLVGGAALFLPVGGTLLVLGLLGDVEAWGLLGGGTIVFIAGLLDDVKGISARHKIAAQVLAGLLLVLTGFRLPGFGIPGVGVLEVGSEIVNIGLLLFWIVLATNAFNLSDGLDGLATSLAVLGLGVLVSAGVGTLLPVALAGGLLGFLYYNLPRARLFLGDAGSLLLGFLLAALVLKLPVHVNVPLTVAAFAYSLGDLTLAVVRRSIRGKPLFSADRSHVHHKALQYLHSNLRGLLALLAFATLQASLLVVWPGIPALVACGALWFLLAAALALAGNYRPAQLAPARRSMRRLHAHQNRAVADLTGARSRAEVEEALQGLAEGVDVHDLDVAGLRVARRTGTPPNGQVREVSVRLRCRDPQQAPAYGTWRADPSLGGPEVDLERETIMADLLRQAADRMERLSS